MCVSIDAAIGAKQFLRVVDNLELFDRFPFLNFVGRANDARVAPVAHRDKHEIAIARLDVLREPHDVTVEQPWAQAIALNGAHIRYCEQ